MVCSKPRSRNSAQIGSVRRLFRQRSAVIGMVILSIIILLAIFAPLLTEYKPETSLIGAEGHDGIQRRAKPCIHLFGCPEDQPQHLMGLDGNSRDVFSRILYGARTSLMVGLVVVSTSVFAGVGRAGCGCYAG